MFRSAQLSASSILFLTLGSGAALSVACSSNDGDSGGEDQADGLGGGAGAGTGGTESGTGGADSGTGGADPTWPTGPLRPTRYTIADPELLTGPCAGASTATITSYEVLLGQTHLTPRDWPFQTVSADRPLTVAVAVAGTGAAPAFTATARLDGEELEFCLSGPSTLPASRNDVEASTFRGSVPAAWVRPGLEIEIAFAGE
ncbi:MAG TPA: hypothetical protein VLC09_18845, partial [Polyangiaceae bacterium]|nr:hypothetical protein [Polyangiaceae bacterium]